MAEAASQAKGDETELAIDAPFVEEQRTRAKFLLSCDTFVCTLATFFRPQVHFCLPLRRVGPIAYLPVRVAKPKPSPSYRNMVSLGCVN